LITLPSADSLQKSMAKQLIKKILITGSSGTIGTRLFEKLLEKGYEVVGFDKEKNQWHSHLNKLTIMGNLLDKNDIKKMPADVDLIIHLAANPRVYDLVIKPDLALENIISTYNTLDFARKNNIKRVVFSGSREVYGNRIKMVSKEDDVDITLCESPYAASKISAEALLHSFFECYGINYIICRFSNVYGMYDTSERFVPRLIGKMKQGKDVEIFGKDKVLDFTYLDDCVDGTVRCVEQFETAKNNVFNIASGAGENLVDVAKLIKKKLQSKSNINVKKNRAGEVVKFVANISKAKKVLKYQPQYSTQAGMDLAIQWYSKLYK